MMNSRTKTTKQDWLDNIHIITGESRRAQDIAVELGIDTGAVINPVVCRIGEKDFAVVLMASDKACDPLQLSRALGRPGHVVTRLNEAEISKFTGTNIESLFPIQLASDMPVVLDASLKRFEKLYSRAGSRKCMIETTYKEIKELTQAIVSYAVSA